MISQISMTCMANDCGGGQCRCCLDDGDCISYRNEMIMIRASISIETQMTWVMASCCAKLISLHAETTYVAKGLQ